MAGFGLEAVNAPGGAAVPSDGGSNSVVKNLSDAKAVLDTPTDEKRGRGRPKGPSAKGRADTIPSELSKTLFDGKAWEEVAALPFNVRKLMTGSRVFELDRPQKEILGSSLGAVMEALGVLDPKYLALTVFSVNMATIFAEKEVAYALIRPRKDKTEKKDNAEKETF